MRGLGPIAALVLAAGAPVAGADEIPFDAGLMADCVDAGRNEACIGLAARDCIERDGPMSAGICMGAENLWWMERAARTVEALRPREAEMRDRARQRGWPETLPTLDEIGGLMDAYRNAACGWHMAAWDGLHAGFEEMDCLLTFNARHALWLEERLRTD
ncbi:MAG: hypothetical protein Kow0013_15570 [Pararhodobacter sp.]